MVGQSVGNYRIVKLLGEGGMGTVYLALHPTLGRRAAVKVLHADLARSNEMIQRFFNEARAANAVGHRGIVEVSDMGVLGSGAPYIVMEFLDGESLATRMTKTGPLSGRLSLGEAVEIAAQVAGVVGAAHAKGIVHRDLKPDNLFLIADPHLPGRELLKVLDFGIAKLARRPSAGGDLLTRTGAVLGTPRYMSPEQCRDSRDVDHRSDIYSLGVILYEMLSGTPPFASNSWGELAHMHIGVSPPALQTRVPDVPAEIERIVLRALEKDPAARFQSMAAFREVLEAAAGSRTLVLPEPAPATAAAAPQEPGATMRWEDPPSARATRATTLASAASEVALAARPSKHRVPTVPLLVAGALAVAFAIIWLLVGRGAPPMAPVAASPVAPAAAPPPAVVEPPAATEPLNAPSAAEVGPIAPPDRETPAAPASEKIARPARVRPARRPRPPAKPAAPGPTPAPGTHLRPEPLKI